MRFLAFFFAVLFSTSSLLAQEIEAVILPTEVMEEMQVSPDDSIIKGKVWNRWTTDNFVVCSLSNSKAKYLHDNLENVKTWLYQRWGMYDIDFEAECKLICVDDPELFKKLFRLERSVVEIRRDADGKIKETVAFLLLNEPPSETLPMPLTEICLAEFEQEYDIRFGWWVHRGMAVLNSTVPHIRKSIAEQMKTLANDEPTFFSKSLMNTTEDDYNSFSVEKKQMFDRSAMMMCLMLKKEFGTTKFQEVMKGTAVGSNVGAALKSQLGFEDYNKFDRSFKRYMSDLFDDVVANRTPDSYLKIEAQ